MELKATNPFCLLLSLTFFLFFTNYALAQVFFSETFNRDIPSSWTAITLAGNNAESANWVYTSKGPNNTNYPPIESPSANNGWVIFDSDYNCSEKNQDAWLVSPPISGLDRERIFLIFETVYRRFNDKVFIRVGSNIGDLESWAKIELFEDLNNNDFSYGTSYVDRLHNPHNIVVDLTPYAAGQSSFRFAFQFISDPSTVQAGDIYGCAWFWQIDDIHLAELTNDLKIDTVRVAPNYATPISQVSPINFAAIVDNFGLVDQNTVRLKAAVSDDIGVITEVTSQPLDLIEPGQSQMISMQNGYTPMREGTYYLDYSVNQSQTDENRSSNHKRTEFIITKTVFTKDNGQIAGVTQPGTINNNTWEIGHVFNIPNPGDKAMSIEFAISSGPPLFDGSYKHEGETVNVFLYEVKEDNNDEIFNDNDVVVAGFGSYTFGKEANEEPVNAPLIDLNTGEFGVPLKAGTQYIAMIELTKELYAPYSLLPYYFDPATVVKNDIWFLGGFRDTRITPIVRLRIQGDTPVSVDSPELEDHQVQLFPNPVKDELQINYELRQLSSTLKLSILDASGKIMADKVLSNAKEGTLKWNVADFPAGSYFLFLKAEEGMKTKLFTVKQ